MILITKVQSNNRKLSPGDLLQTTINDVDGNTIKVNLNVHKEMENYDIVIYRFAKKNGVCISPANVIIVPENNSLPSELSDAFSYKELPPKKFKRFILSVTPND